MLQELPVPYKTPVNPRIPSFPLEKLAQIVILKWLCELLCSVSLAGLSLHVLHVWSQEGTLRGPQDLQNTRQEPLESRGMGHHYTPTGPHHPRMWHPENALSLPFADPVLELETEPLPLCTGSPGLRNTMLASEVMKLAQYFWKRYGLRMSCSLLYPQQEPAGIMAQYIPAEWMYARQFCNMHQALKDECPHPLIPFLQHILRK